MSLDNQVTKVPLAPISGSSFFPEFRIIYLLSLVSKAHISTQHKMFIAKFVSLVFHVYFNVMSAIC